VKFVTMDAPPYGTVQSVGPHVARVTAANPSKFTYHGTGTYIVGDGPEVVVIDPGPTLDTHRDALASAVDGLTVTAIVVTHCHSDHSPLAPWLSGLTAAPVLAFGPHGSDVLDADLVGALARFDADHAARHPAPAQPEPVMEESVDVAFRPDVALADGDVAAELRSAGSTLVLRAVHTPGHTSNHLCLTVESEGRSVLFTGDHVMGWSTTVVGPPDGDMAAYVDSLRRVAARPDQVLYPTHGAPMGRQPQQFVAQLIAHRLHREQQIVEALTAAQHRTLALGDLVPNLYADVRHELHKPAARSVLSHLLKLQHDGRLRRHVVGDGGVVDLRFELTRL
jgi:glyoxylase-like metal-dependent hydrolase (beta-lactamase superfamily II)